MKSFLLLLAAAGLVAAQNLDGQPACASPCLSSAISAICTPVTDETCACASQSAIGASAAACLISACTDSTDLLSAETAGSAQCAAFSASATATATATDSGSASSGGSASAGTATATATEAGSSGAGATATGASGSASAAATSTAGAGISGPVVGGGLLGGVLAAIAVLL